MVGDRARLAFEFVSGGEVVVCAIHVAGRNDFNWHSGADHTFAEHRGHVAAASNDHFFEAGIDGVEDVARLTRLFEFEHDSPIRSRVPGDMVCTFKSLDSEVFACGARGERGKSFIEKLLEDFTIPEADRAIGANVLGVVAAVADQAIV